MVRLVRLSVMHEFVLMIKGVMGGVKALDLLEHDG